jgi:hypothetical protein
MEMGLTGRRGKRILLIGGLTFAAMILLSLYPGGVGAHSPGEVKFTYDQATQTLTTTVTHTRFSDSHYVAKVQIKKNGSPVSLVEYKDQPAETFTYSYKVAAIAGDTLEVSAYCNKFGSKTQKLTVGEPVEPALK